MLLRREVVRLEAEEVASGVLRRRPNRSRARWSRRSAPGREAVAAIVLNGNGVPGIGEAASERLLPGGFRVAISQNASDFDHPQTLIVVGSPDDVRLGRTCAKLAPCGERVRVGGYRVSLP